MVLLPVLMASLLIASVLLPASAAHAGERRAAYVGWAGWNEKGIRFHMTVKEAAEILGRQAYDGCGGSPGVYPSPRRLFIGHPLSPLDTDIDKVQVAYMGGYTRNIHVPHGIHPGMRLSGALKRMGSDAVRVVGKYARGYYEMGPNGTHAMFIQVRERRVSQVGVVWSKRFAVRMVKSPGC